MDENRVSKFYISAVRKTKDSTLAWSRVSSSVSSTLSLQNASLAIYALDTERSFIAKYGEGEIALIRDSLDDKIGCFIKPDKNLSYQQVGTWDDSDLIRLYNIVYSLFPSVDSFLDSFIQDSE